MKHALFAPFTRIYTISREGADIVVPGKHMMAVWWLSLLFVVPPYAQGQQEAAKIFDGMPPDVQAKVRSLAHILQQGISEGTLTEDEISRGLMSGQLKEKLKLLNPQSDQLLQDISEASKEGKGPGEESLMPLLGEVGISQE